MTIEEILQIVHGNEEAYRKAEPIRVIDTVQVPECKTVKEFLLWYLNDCQKTLGYNSPCTVYVHKAAPDNTQCYNGKNRSTRDLFNLVQYYFPNTSLEEVICNLVELNETLQIETLQCPQIERRVWYRNCRESTNKTVMSSYDRNNAQKIKTLTDNLNYSHLFQLYEYSKQESAVAC